MKAWTAVCARVCWPMLTIALATLSLSTSAQSGRAVPAAHTPSPQVAPSDRPDARPGVAADGDGYRLIFPASFEGARLLVGEEAAERARTSEMNSFIEQLNEAGAQGYKLITAVYAGIPVAVVRLDEVQYEYAWFGTGSSLFEPLDSFTSIYGRLSKLGFRLRMRALVERSCRPLDPENHLAGEYCAFSHLFLLAREKGAGEPGQYRIVGTAPGWGANPALELTAKVEDKLAQGFYPTHVLSKSEILLEQPAEGGGLPPDRPDVRVVNSSWRRDVQKKVNELAKQGYRLALTNNGLAVMYRRGGGTAPCKYVWLRATDRDFEKKLAGLQQSGAVYRMTYPNEDGREARLIFEQDLSPGSRRREYRVLKFALDFVENAAEKKVYIDLTPSGKEAMRTLNRLVQEGFTVRDLFYSGERAVILERQP